MLHIQTGNPNIDLFRALSVSNAPIILEFTSYDIVYESNQKIFYVDVFKVNQILDAIENAIRGHRQRIYALSIMDEIETNPETLETLQTIINEIKKRPLLADIKLWINFDNVYPVFTGNELIIPENIDLVSLTPEYGRLCGRSTENVLCETNRYKYFLEAVSNYNNSHPGQPIDLIVIGDGWDRSGISENHIKKSELLYNEVKNLADNLKINIAGELVFTYSDPLYSVKTDESLKEVWKNIGKKFLSGNVGMSSSDKLVTSEAPKDPPVQEIPEICKPYLH